MTNFLFVGKANDSPVVLPVIGRITQPIPSGSGAWVNLEYSELEKLVSDWFRSPQSNLGLLINATDRQGTNLAVVSHQHTESGSVSILLCPSQYSPVNLDVRVHIVLTS